MCFYFRNKLTHEPCDRHGYTAYWTRDLSLRPVGTNSLSTIKNLTEFLRYTLLHIFVFSKKKNYDIDNFSKLTGLLGIWFRFDLKKTFDTQVIFFFFIFFYFFLNFF